MYLYSINGLHNEIEETEYYRQKRPSEKAVLIDKINWLVHSIVVSNRHNWSLSDFKPVPLLKGTLQDVLGTTEYLKVKQLLKDYVNEDEHYLPKALLEENDKRKPTSKTYSLKDKALKKGIVKVGVISERMIKKIKSFKRNSFLKYQKEPYIHSKIIDSLTKVQFNPEHPKALKALKEAEGCTDKEEYYKKTYTELQEMNSFNDVKHYAESDFFYYTQSENVNRVFHYLSTIPKEYRESLSLKNGGTLTEIDLKNSQPLIIGLNYLHSLTNLSTTDANLLKDILGGRLYRRVAKQAIKNEDLKTYNLFTEDYSDFKAKVLGQGLYFNYIPTLEDIKPMEKYLIQLYPDFMKYIRKRKLENCKKIGYKEGFKIISQEAQRIESNIFIENFFTGLKKGTDISIPVHDSVIVPTEKTDYYLNRLINTFRGRFPFLPEEQVKNLFRITNY